MKCAGPMVISNRHRQSRDTEGWITPAGMTSAQGLPAPHHSIVSNSLKSKMVKSFAMFIWTVSEKSWLFWNNIFWNCQWVQLCVNMNLRDGLYQRRRHAIKTPRKDFFTKMEIINSSCHVMCNHLKFTAQPLNQSLANLTLTGPLNTALTKTPAAAAVSRTKYSFTLLTLQVLRFLSFQEEQN